MAQQPCPLHPLTPPQLAPSSHHPQQPHTRTLCYRAAWEQRGPGRVAERHACAHGEERGDPAAAPGRADRWGWGGDGRGINGDGGGVGAGPGDGRGRSRHGQATFLMSLPTHRRGGSPPPQLPPWQCHRHMFLHNTTLKAQAVAAFQGHAERCPQARWAAQSRHSGPGSRGGGGTRGLLSAGSGVAARLGRMSTSLGQTISP